MKEYPCYTIRRAASPPPLEAPWDASAWQGADALTVDSFHPASSNHRPFTQARMLYDPSGLYGIFRVEDRYVLSTRTEYQSAVCRDACVEFFTEPKAGMGYFNFEMNCGGTLLASYIEDCTRISDPKRPGQTFEKYTHLSEASGAQVRIRSSMPRRITPEKTEPVTWTLSFHIPKAVLEAFIGPLGNLAGQEWRGNFHKCAEDCSHPHWATWATIGEELNFHKPACFAPLRFAL